MCSHTAKIYVEALSFQLLFLPPQNQAGNQIPEHHGGQDTKCSYSLFQPTAGSPLSTLRGSFSL